MKVFYKNKVGILTESDVSQCPDCIFYPKSNKYQCYNIGLMHFCCKVKYYRFVADLNTSIFKL